MIPWQVDFIIFSLQQSARYNGYICDRPGRRGSVGDIRYLNSTENSAASGTSAAPDPLMIMLRNSTNVTSTLNVERYV